MPSQTIDAAISKISYKGDFITDDLKLVIKDKLTGDVYYDYPFTLLPDTSTAEKFQFYTAVISDFMPDKIMLFQLHGTIDAEEHLLGMIEHKFDHAVQGDQKIPIFLNLPVQYVPEESVVLKGDFVIRYCKYRNTDIGRIPELINTTDCICKYLSAPGGSSAIKSELTKRIKSLNDELNVLFPILSSPPGPDPGMPDLQPTPCALLSKIKSQLIYIRDNQDAIAADGKDITKAVRLVFELYWYFVQNVGLDFCAAKKTFRKNANTRSQSEELYLQASGSNGETGITQGIHLRWALTGKLGSKHLPKGNLATDPTSPFYTTAGYSDNADDYVHIYRTPYVSPSVFEFDLNDEIEIKVTPLPGQALDKWEFSYKGRFMIIQIEMELPFDYDSSPYFAPLGDSVYTCYSVRDFLHAYPKVFSVEVIDRDTDGSVTRPSNMAFAIEIVSNFDSETTDSIDLCLYTFEGKDQQVPFSVKGALLSNDPFSGTVRKKIFSEQIHRSWYRFTNADIDKLRFEFYDDFIFNPNREWDEPGKFALTLSEPEVFNRLEGVGYSYNLEEFWPRYNDGVYIRSNNYKAKWNAAAEGVKVAVDKYLDLSRTANNLKAVGTLSGTDGNTKASHLDILKFLSLDYHTARMLGLGHIEVNLQEQVRYVHLAFYKSPTEENLSAKTDWAEHMFMSLPTKWADARPPFVPLLDEFTHEVPTEDNCSGSKLADADGYSYFDDSRCININRGRYVFEDQPANVVAFLASADAEGFYNLTGDHTKPYFYGIEYGAGYIPGVPELTNHPSLSEFIPDYEVYTDHYDNGDELIGVPEVMLVPEKSNPLYTHFEKESGNHLYALYSVNWFAKASAVGNVKDIETTFINKNIKPPLDLAVQFIQEENPVVFTSTAEQTMLAGRKVTNPSDPYVTRATFNWNDYHNSNYQYANQVHFYFRPTLPVEIKGKTFSVTAVPGLQQSVVVTKAVKLVSAVPQKTVSPEVLPGLNPSIFAGSMLSVASGQFKVISAIRDAANSNFIKLVVENELVVKKEEKIDPLTGLHTFQSVCSYKAPAEDELFTVTENMDAQGAWTKLRFAGNKVVITNFLTGTGQVYSESYVDENGNPVELKIGGIFVQNGKITPINTAPYNFEGSYPPCYEIEFDYTLPVNPAGNSTNVEFYGGTVRLKDALGNMRPLTVFNISRPVASKVVLHAVDSLGGPSAIAIGTSAMKVNFHPGYRIYLTPEGSFNKSTILPAAPSQVKKTMMAAKPYDSSNPFYVTNPFEAPFSAFASLTSVRVDEPVIPGDPRNDSLFATRPDKFGKSSYTYDTEINIAGYKPFALSFSRASDEAILRALYTNATLYGTNGIRSRLLSIENNNQEDQRFKELVQVTLNGSNQFNPFNGYALPFPDNAANTLILPGDSPAIKAAKIKQAIINCFVPVNSQPCVLDYIKTSTTKRTSSRKPAIRDAAGNLLTPATGFDPFPYCVQYTDAGKTYVRFTDYTLEGKSLNRYFYFTKEISNTLKHSDPSKILGPVNLVNSAVFEAPYFQKHEILLANPLLSQHAGVRFTVKPYPQEAGVTMLEVYRAFGAERANDIAAMTLVGKYSLEDITDVFSGYKFAPVEEPVYYKLVGVRPIRNEFIGAGSEHEADFIRSAPSKLITVQIPDSVNPAAPVLSVLGNLSTSVLSGLQLEFVSTMYKGKYSLYKLTPGGNWRLTDSMDNPGNDEVLRFSLPDLNGLNASSEVISHCYKVIAENRSGLLSIEEQVCVVRMQ